MVQMCDAVRRRAKSPSAYHTRLMALWRRFPRVVHRGGQLLGLLAAAWCVGCAAAEGNRRPKSALSSVARADALAHSGARSQARCEVSSEAQSLHEEPQLQSVELDLERPPAAPALEERLLGTSCEEALISCLETETVKVRTLWSWENGGRLELSMGGRSKIGAVYHQTW